MRMITMFPITLLLCALPLVAQGTPKAATPNESLLIGPGDLLQIAVYDTPQLDQHPRVDDEGSVPLLFAGRILVKGDTPGQAAAAIEKRLIDTGVMKHPQVSVTVAEYATQAVSVMGQVEKPGNYDIRTPRTVFEVLSMAGGLTPLADRNVMVRRAGDGGRQETYFIPNTPAQASLGTVKVFPGDTIVVAKEDLVYVLGDVARPGGYPKTMNDGPVTLLQTLAEAGSANKSAVLSGTRLLRRTNGAYTLVPVDIGKISKGKAPDLELQANDVLYVPFSYAKNFLLNGSAIATSVAAAAVFVP